MGGTVQEFIEEYNPARHAVLLPDDYEAPDKPYWAKLRQFGDRHMELSVCRPNKRLPAEQRTKDGAKKVRELSEAERQARDQENLRRAVRRARQAVRAAVKALNADHMLTLTYRENMQDEARLKRDFKEFVRLVRLRYASWQYVAVREKQDRGAYHIHMAVRGKQPIRWLLRCWLRAIGQPEHEVNDWFMRGVALGERSFGAVNVRAPRRDFGGAGQSWKPDRLAGYMTKYLHKEFSAVDKFAKRYWASRDIARPQMIRMWLGSSTFADALNEAVRVVNEQGVSAMTIFADQETGNIWISASGPPRLALRAPCPF
jgi:hypothetical protein